MQPRDDLPRAIECILFAAGEPVPLKRLAEVLDVPPETAAAAVRDLEALLHDRGLQVIKLAGGYALATRPEFAEYVSKLRQRPPERLSAAAVEVLAIVAYRQPVTKPEIDQIRGVDSSSALRSLLAKRMIAIKGRKRAPGRPALYVTTEHFLRAFGLNDLSELPEMPGGLPARARQMRLTGLDAES